MIPPDFLITTTSIAEGWTIEAHLAPLSAHVVAGTNIFSDLMASLSDVFGGRSRTYQNQLASIHDEAVMLLVKRAKARGANGIIGVSIDHSDISGQGKSMFMVTAYGTAVRATPVKPIPARNHADFVLDIEVEAQFKRRRLVRKVSKGEGLADDEWEFVAQHNLVDVITTLFDVLEARGSQPVNETLTKASRKAVRASTAMDAELLARTVYPVLSSSTSSVVELAMAIIKENSLVRYDEADRLLSSGRLSDRLNALRVLDNLAPSYTAHDVKVLTEIANRVVSAFPAAHPEQVRGMFGEKEVWRCVCGGFTAASVTTCSRCRRDSRGIEDGGKSPEQVAKWLRECSKILDGMFDDALSSK
jgi:uncharacterized protein YbjQ (UPF0145 family)